MGRTSETAGKLASIFILSACASSTPPAPEVPPQATPSEPTSSSAATPKNNESHAAKESLPAAGMTTAKAKPAAPQGPQSISINYDEISAELGIPRSRLESQTKILAHFMDSRALPRGLCSNDEDESTEKLCSLTDLVQNQPRASRTRHDTARRVPIRPQHFAAQQNMSYSRLQRSLAREPVARVLAWSGRMLATTSCPRNLSAAALRRLESGLPSNGVKLMMEKLYEHASACLHPQDEGYEITHLRQGLLRILWGNSAAAKISFEKSTLAEDSSDRPRALYWAGRLQANSPARTKYWDKLIEEYPLSFHSLEVWRVRNQDPLQIFEARPALSLSRHIDNDDINNAMRWLEALYVGGYTGSAQKLARWMNATYKDVLPPSTAFYISALKSSRSTQVNTVIFLTQQVNENPSMLNQQTLKLLFPRPYFDIFERNANETDTALILSVARQESGFNPYAQSPSHAQGILQLLPSTARRLSGKRRNNLFDADTNARLGTKFLSNLIQKFNSVELALAAYNAGPGRINEWTDRYPTKDTTLFMDLIPFKETRHYVANIVRNNYWYDRLYASENAASRSIASESHRGRQKSHLVTRLVEAHVSARKSPAAIVGDDL